MSVLIFHGTADRLVPIEGARRPFQVGPHRTDTSAADTIAFWVKKERCSATPRYQETKEVQIDSYSRCRGGTGVALYAIQGGRHIWPGVPMSHNHVPAMEIIWEFVAQHPKPDR